MIKEYGPTPRGSLARNLPMTSNAPSARRSAPKCVLPIKIDHLKVSFQTRPPSYVPAPQDVAKFPHAVFEYLPLDPGAEIPEVQSASIHVAALLRSTGPVRVRSGMPEIVEGLTVYRLSWIDDETRELQFGRTGKAPNVPPRTRSHGSPSPKRVRTQRVVDVNVDVNFSQQQDVPLAMPSEPLPLPFAPPVTPDPVGTDQPLTNHKDDPLPEVSDPFATVNWELGLVPQPSLWRDVNSDVDLEDGFANNEDALLCSSDSIISAFLNHSKEYDDDEATTADVPHKTPTPPSVLDFLGEDCSSPIQPPQNTTCTTFAEWDLYY